MNPATDQSSELFGPYEVYERLGLGGMATVYRAKKRGPAGFERSVALKRMLSHLAEDPSFVESFVREAKVASMLVHPNIAQVYDFGRISGSYYIAMELVAGFDVRKLLRYANRANEAIPMPVILSIIGELCDALDYAHTFVDETGQPLNIVHRDISPSNMIVAHTGHLKVIDFGIAKANSRSLHTESGMVKGKLGYMSPEVAVGMPVGPVADIFSVGVVAWELVTASPLFSARTDFETMRKIREEPIAAPSKLNPACPPKLDQIILAAVERDSDSRLASARLFRQALDGIAHDLGIHVSARAVQEWILRFTQPDDSWARGLAASTSGATRSRSPSGRTLPLPPEPPTQVVRTARAPTQLRRSPDDIQLATEIWGEDARTVEEPGPALPDFHQRLAEPPPSRSGSSIPAQVTPSQLAGLPIPSVTAPQRPARKTNVAAHAQDAAAAAAPHSAAVGLAAATAAGSAQAAAGRAAAAPAASAGAPVRSSSGASASSLAAPTATAARSSKQPFVILGALALVAAALAALLIWKRTSEAPTNAAIRFEIQPAGAQVMIADNALGHTSPLDTQLGPGTYPIKVELDGYKPYTSTITVRAGEHQTIHVALDKEDTEIAIDSPPPAPEPPPAAEPRVINPFESTDKPAKPTRPSHPAKHEAKHASKEKQVAETEKAPPPALEPPKVEAPKVEPPKPPEPDKPVETKPARTPVVAANAVTKLSGDVPTLRAKNAEGSGDVLAKLCIDEQGRVASVKIVKSNPEIASELQSALASWRYRPYLKDGKPSPVCFPLSLRVVVKGS